MALKGEQKMLTNKEFAAEVRRDVKKAKELRNRYMAACICPECGDKLLCSDHTGFACRSCNFTYNRRKKRTKTMIKADIMAKVREKEEHLRDLRRCLDVEICPECGRDLRYYPGGRYICSVCGFKYNR